MVAGDSAEGMTPRSEAIRQAFRLEWLTVGWLALEAAVAIIAGVRAGSLSLTAFGLDSVIELASAFVLIWRLNVELRHGRVFSEEAERLSSRIGGGLLLLLAASITAGALWRLWSQQGGEFSLSGLLVALLAIPVMAVLSRRKIALATRLGSRAMRADAVESITCGWLSLVVVIGLIAKFFLDAWWVDAVTSLAIVWFLAKEGREAWAGEQCCCGHD